MNPNDGTSSYTDLTPEEQADHDRSVHDYPHIQFSPTEYVVIDVQRSFWGLVQIWLLVTLAAAVLIATVYIMGQTTLDSNVRSYVGIIGLGSLACCLIGGLIATWVFRANYFVVTNERIFARIQISPFSQRSQNVEIEHIEDCSYHQTGVIQTLLNYGSIRLSTVGDEQTYKFNFVAHPSEQLKIINRVVHAVDEQEPTRYRG